MKLRINWYIFWLIVLLLACKDTKDLAPVQKDTYKPELLSRIIVGEKYWRLEQVIQVSGNDSVFMKYDGTGPAPKYWIGSWGGRFLADMKLELVNAIPVPGNLPFGDQSTLAYFPGYLQPEFGKWFWDYEKGTLGVEAISSVSRGRGYLDKSAPPVCRSVVEAVALGRPDRMRFIFPQEENSQEDVTYVYCLRAAWLLEIAAKDRSKYISYRVLY